MRIVSSVAKSGVLQRWMGRIDHWPSINSTIVQNVCIPQQRCSGLITNTFKGDLKNLLVIDRTPSPSPSPEEYEGHPDSPERDEKGLTADDRRLLEEEEAKLRAQMDARRRAFIESIKKQATSRGKPVRVKREPGRVESERPAKKTKNATHIEIIEILDLDSDDKEFTVSRVPIVPAKKTMIRTLTLDADDNEEPTIKDAFGGSVFQANTAVEAGAEPLRDTQATDNEDAIDVNGAPDYKSHVAESEILDEYGDNDFFFSKTPAKSRSKSRGATSR